MNYVTSSSWKNVQPKFLFILFTSHSKLFTGSEWPVEKWTGVCFKRVFLQQSVICSLLFQTTNCVLLSFLPSSSSSSSAPFSLQVHYTHCFTICVLLIRSLSRSVCLNLLMIGAIERKPAEGEEEDEASELFILVFSLSPVSFLCVSSIRMIPR